MDAEFDRMIEFTNMVKERQPALAERIDAEIAKVIAEVGDTFQPYIDLADEKITVEEFQTIMAKRDAIDVARREARYGAVGPWTVECMDCGRSFVSDDLPVLYPQCEDVGEMCDVTDDEDDDDAEP